MKKEANMEKKIILDVNIWISFFITGKFHDLGKLIFDNKLDVQTSPSLIDELQDVISRRKISKNLKYPLSEYLNFHFEMTSFVNTQKTFSGSPDIKDDYLFDLAIQSNTNIIVTGDKKLLDFEVENIKMISLKDFLSNPKI